MASPSELSLECKPPQSQYSLTVLNPNFGVADNKSTSSVPQQQGATAIDGHSTQKLEEYLSQLEEERLKIDAFKRELPLCMQLLSNAMEVSRQQLQSCRSTIIDEKPRPVLEEFIPINKQHSSNPDDDDMTTCFSDQSNKAPKNATDKSNWMISAQLWSNTNIQAATKQQQQEQEAQNHHDHQIIGSAGPRLTLIDVNMQRNNGDGGNRGGGGGRAFLPFSKDHHHRHTSSLPNLALTPNGGSEIADDKKLCLNGLSSEYENKGKSMNSGFMVGKPTGEDCSQTTTSTNAGGTTTATTGQNQRKQRRCWSPDLHRRFVSALQMLGGSQVATPKQIRELMKVDGLTNDEVKSHLQKYRLHTRRPGPISPQATGSSAPQLVVLGGIWVPPEYAAHHHAHGGPPTIYSTHPTTQMSSQPSHYPPDFYQPGPPPQTLLHHPQLQIHHHHPHNNHHHIHQLHTYNNIPPSSRQTQSSPETEERGVSRERSVSTEDDGRSESSNWKNGGGVKSSSGEERKINTLRRLTSSMREGDDEESNGSEITLKF